MWTHLKSREAIIRCFPCMYVLYKYSYKENNNKILPKKIILGYENTKIQMLHLLSTMYTIDIDIYKVGVYCV